MLIKCTHENISGDIEGVFNPIAKMFIVLHKIVFSGFERKISPIVYLRIRTSGLIYETKRMTYLPNTALNIKQGFMMYFLHDLVLYLTHLLMCSSKCFFWRMTGSSEISLRRSAKGCISSRLLISFLTLVGMG